MDFRGQAAVWFIRGKRVVFATRLVIRISEHLNQNDDPSRYEQATSVGGVFAAGVARIQPVSVDPSWFLRIQLLLCRGNVEVSQTGCCVRVVVGNRITLAPDGLLGHPSSTMGFLWGDGYTPRRAATAPDPELGNQK